MAKPNTAPDEFSRLKSAIKERRLERLYFFHGEETFLLNHYLGQMKKIALGTAKSLVTE